MRRSLLSPLRSAANPVLNIIVLDPISTEGLTAADVDELTRKTHEVMLKEMIALTEKARGRSHEDGVNGKQTANGVAPAAGTEGRVRDEL